MTERAPWRSRLLVRVAAVVIAAGIGSLAVGTLVVIWLVGDDKEAHLMGTAVLEAESRAAAVDHRIELARAQLLAIGFASESGHLAQIPNAAEGVVALLASRGEEELLAAGIDDASVELLRSEVARSPRGVVLVDERIVVSEVIDGVLAAALVDARPLLETRGDGSDLRLGAAVRDAPLATIARRYDRGGRVLVRTPLRSGLVLELDASLEIAQAAALALSRRMVLWSSLVVVPLALMAWFLARAVTAPVRRLASAVRAAEDEPIPLVDLPPDEIGDLGSAIHAMSARVHADARGLRAAVHFSRGAGRFDEDHVVLEQLREALGETASSWRICPASDFAEQRGITRRQIVKRASDKDGSPDRLGAMMPACRAVVLDDGYIAIPLVDEESDHGILLGEPETPTSDIRMAELLARTALVRLRSAALARKLLVGEKLSALGRLSASVAHEMNTPLAYVKANLLSLDDAQTSDRAEMLADARMGVERLVRIVRDLSSLSVGGTEVSPETVDLGALVRDISRMSGLRRPGATIGVTADGPIAIDCDRGRIEQAVVNLINNALDAAREPARVVVRLMRHPKDVVIEIQDNGTGIPPEATAQLFEPFYTTKGRGGTGLGLYLSRSFVVAHGGTLELASTSPDGTCFRIRLPAVASPVLAASRPPPLDSFRPERSSERPRVLIIDDEPAVVRAMKRWLKGRADVVGITEPSDAIERIVAGSFDLILCDMNMPGLTGEQLAATLRDRAPALAERMVIVTGSCSPAPPGLPVVRKPLDEAALEKLLAGVTRDGAERGAA